MKEGVRQCWTEFRPTIFFLARFVGLYLALNLLYGVYVTAFAPRADPATAWVTHQTSLVLQVFGWENQTYNHPGKPTVFISYEGQGVVSIYEGCNGLNVAIVFVSFLVAFGPHRKALAWFVPLGFLLIHLVNLARIALLFYVSLRMPEFLYVTHKYLFTAVLYLVVMALWGAWLWMHRPRAA